MDNNKRSTLKVEVPRNRRTIKEILIDAGLEGLKETLSSLSKALDNSDGNSSGAEITIDIPKINIISGQNDTDSSSVEQDYEQEEEE